MLPLTTRSSSPRRQSCAASAHPAQSQIRDMASSTCSHSHVMAHHHQPHCLVLLRQGRTTCAHRVIHIRIEILQTLMNPCKRLAVIPCCQHWSIQTWRPLSYPGSKTEHRQHLHFLLSTSGFALTSHFSDIIVDPIAAYPIEIGFQRQRVFPELCSLLYV